MVNFWQHPSDFFLFLFINENTKEQNAEKIQNNSKITQGIKKLSKSRYKCTSRRNMIKNKEARLVIAFLFEHTILQCFARYYFCKHLCLFKTFS